MEVPERMLNMFPAAGDQAARIFRPGAVTSGCVTTETQSELKSLRMK